jgi:hypothetical protein
VYAAAWDPSLSRCKVSVPTVLARGGRSSRSGRVDDPRKRAASRRVQCPLAHRRPPTKARPSAVRARDVGSGIVLTWSCRERSPVAPMSGNAPPAKNPRASFPPWMSEIAPLMSRLKSGPTGGGSGPPGVGTPLSIVNDPNKCPCVTFV